MLTSKSSSLCHAARVQCFKGAMWKAMILKEQKGILAFTGPHTGRQISERVKELVQMFYRDNNYSKQMSGKRVYVSIKNKVYMVQEIDFL